MALIGGGWLNGGGGPMRWRSCGISTITEIKGVWSDAGSYRNFYAGQGSMSGGVSFANKSGYPSGYRHPASWSMPIKAGGLSSRNNTDIDFSESASLVGGVNGESTATITFTIDGTGGLVVAGSGTATITFTPDGSIIAVAPGVGSSTISFAASADIGAIAALIASANITFSPDADPHAIGYLEGTSSSDAEFSADNLARAVWDALAASYNNAGTMGEKMNDAGSASNPWTEEIEPGYTAEEILRIIAAVLAGKVSGAGTGTEVFRDITDVKDRVTSTVDVDGNRTALTLDGS